MEINEKLIEKAKRFFQKGDREYAYKVFVKLGNKLIKAAKSKDLPVFISTANYF